MTKFRYHANSFEVTFLWGIFATTLPLILAMYVGKYLFQSGPHQLHGAMSACVNRGPGRGGTRLCRPRGDASRRRGERGYDAWALRLLGNKGYIQEWPKQACATSPTHATDAILRERTPRVLRYLPGAEIRLLCGMLTEQNAAIGSAQRAGLRDCIQPCAH